MFPVFVWRQRWAKAIPLLGPLEEAAVFTALLRVQTGNRKENSDGGFLSEDMRLLLLAADPHSEGLRCRDSEPSTKDPAIPHVINL